jgi:hypothetical protein
MAEGQENCYACGQHVRTRAFRHERRVNPIVIIAAGLTVVVVFGGLLLIRASAARKQAALLAEEETLRVQDSSRRASREWQDALRIAKNDDEARSLTAELDNIDGRFQSIRTRVASRPSPRQESIIREEEAELALLRHSIVVLASSPDDKKPAQRDSIQAGKRRVEDLTKELGGNE